MISPETIALVRERTNVVAVIQESVPSLKRRGRSWVGLCPFHKEKTPSFHVNPDRGFFHCFGCHESGSAIDFLMKHDGLTFPEAVRALADRCGIEVQEDTRRDSTEVDRQKKHRDDLYSVLQVAAAFYERQLHEHPDRAYATEELEKRGVAGAQETLQAFRIGYAPAAWDSLAQHLKAQGLSPALAEEVGLLVPRSSGSGHYDRFRHRLMFAVMDTQGRVVAFSGRALEEIEQQVERGGQGGRSPPLGSTQRGDPQGGERAEHARRDAVPPMRDPPPKYINSPESPVYTKGNLLFGLFQARHAIRQEDTAVLVEGNFDVVSLHARGLDHVVAPLGTAFTEEQAKLLRRYAGRVIVCFDGDAAGRKATRAAREPCRAAGIAARVAIMPPGSDPDALAREKGIDAVKDAVAQSRELLRFLIDDAMAASFSAADVYERSARVRIVARLIADEEDPLARSLLKTYADEVAGRLDLVRREDSGRGEHSPETFRMLQSLMEKELRQAQAQDQRGPKRGESAEAPQRARVSLKNPGAPARREIVGALLDYPELLADPEVQAATVLLEGNSARAVAALAECTKSSHNGEKTLYTTEFLAQMPPAIHAFAAERLAAPVLESMDEAKAVVLSNAEKLKSMMTQRETKELSEELQSGAQDWETELALAEEAAKRQKRTRGLGGGGQD